MWETHNYVHRYAHMQCTQWWALLEKCYNVHKVCIHGKLTEWLTILNAGINPLDDLSVSELRKELDARGVPTGRKLKPELATEFNDLRQGLNDVPALLQPTPRVSLEELNLEHYEISPIEPLHDLKGHLGNIIDETMETVRGKALEKLTNIKVAHLTKDTLRCSDYRKAVILIHIALKQTQPASTLTEVFRTAVEICEILYSKPEKRTRKQVLRLHNITFLHCMLCREVFSSPKSVEKCLADTFMP